jgi:hypothetical protein
MWKYVENNILNKKLWEELISYFPLKRHEPHRKWCLQQFFVAAGTSLQSCYEARIGDINRQTHTLSFDKTRITEKITCPTILLLLRVFVAVGTCVLSRFLAPNGWIHLTEPLSCSDRKDTHTDTQTDGRDFLSTPLKWTQVPWYTYQDS